MSKCGTYINGFPQHKIPRLSVDPNIEQIGVLVPQLLNYVAFFGPVREGNRILMTKCYGIKPANVTASSNARVNSA